MIHSKYTPIEDQCRNFLAALEQGVPLSPKFFHFIDTTLRNLWIQARRTSGLAQFERSSEVVQRGRRRLKRYRIPGTKEATQHDMLYLKAVDLFIDNIKGLAKRIQP